MIYVPTGTPSSLATSQIFGAKNYIHVMVMLSTVKISIWPPTCVPQIEIKVKTTLKIKKVIFYCKQNQKYKCADIIQNKTVHANVYK
jgi:hypothetical protein